MKRANVDEKCLFPLIQRFFTSLKTFSGVALRPVVSPCINKSYMYFSWQKLNLVKLFWGRAQPIGKLFSDMLDIIESLLLNYYYNHYY